MKKIAIIVLLLIMAVGFYLVLNPAKQKPETSTPRQEQPIKEPTEEPTEQPTEEPITPEQPTTPEQPIEEPEQGEATPEEEGKEKEYVDYGRNYGTDTIEKELQGTWISGTTKMTIKGDRMTVETEDKITDYKIRTEKGRMYYEIDRKKRMSLYHIMGDTMLWDNIKWERKS